jgi:hypothetical protein
MARILADATWSSTKPSRKPNAVAAVVTVVAVAMVADAAAVVAVAVEAEEDVAAVAVVAAAAEVIGVEIAVMTAAIVGKTFSFLQFGGAQFTGSAIGF